MLAIKIKTFPCFIFPKKPPIKIISSRHKCLSNFKVMNQRVVKKYGWKVVFWWSTSWVVVLDQVKPAANVNPEIDLDSYILKENELIMYCPVYNKSTGMNGGLTRNIGYITLRGDDTERFYSYGFNKEKSSLFYCHMKTPLPNIFSCTAFKKYLPFLLDENQNKAKFWNMLFLLAINSWSKRRFFKVERSCTCIQLI